MSVYQSSAPQCNSLQCIALCVNVYECVAMQCTAPQCNALQCLALLWAVSGVIRRHRRDGRRRGCERVRTRLKVFECV